MKKARPSKTADLEMRAEYAIPWDKAERGKYSARIKAETYLVPIDPELKSTFPDADAVNGALHALARLIHQQSKPRRKSA